MLRDIKLAIVDNQHLFRKGLIALLKKFKGIEILADVPTEAELVERIKVQEPDIVLLNIDLSVVKSMETINHLRNSYPKIKFLILTMQNEDELILQLIKKGANGFLLKDVDIEILVNSIRTMAEQGHCFNDRISQIIINSLANKKKANPGYLKTHELSGREIEVVRLICKEYTNKEVAEKLFISVRTVDGHKEKIMQKINAKNSVGIVLYAIKNNLYNFRQQTAPALYSARA